MLLESFEYAIFVLTFTSNIHERSILLLYKRLALLMLSLTQVHSDKRKFLLLSVITLYQPFETVFLGRIIISINGFNTGLKL